MNRKALIIAITAGTLSLASCSIAERQFIDAVVSDPAPANSVPATDGTPPAVIFEQCDANGGFAEVGHCDTLSTNPPDTPPAVIFEQCDAYGNFAPEGECPPSNSIPATDPPAPDVIVQQCEDFTAAPVGECPTEVVASG